MDGGPQSTAPAPGPEGGGAAGLPRAHAAVRAAHEGDAAALVALINSAYRGEGSKEGWTTEADLLGGQRIDAAGVLELLAQPRASVLAVDGGGGELTACCEVKSDADSADGGDAYFGMFSVGPAAQGRGLGGIVLAEAERYAARTWGARRMRMLVIRQRAELIAWYERRGYARTGRTEPFPYGDERFGLPRRNDLEFIELTKDLAA